MALNWKKYKQKRFFIENLIKKCRKLEVMFQSSRTLLNIVISNDIDLNSEDRLPDDSCSVDTKDDSYRLPRLFH